MYGKINKPFWDDKPVAVIGGGPSLLDLNYEELRGAHVLAVRTSIFDIPWADAAFGVRRLAILRRSAIVRAAVRRRCFALSSGRLNRSNGASSP